jgi:Na+/H+ antiporter NhaC
MVIILSVTNLDFGPMARVEKRAIETGELGALDTELEEKILMDGKGTIWDLIIPISSLIAFSILSMLQNGGYWSGEGLSLSEAFGNCDA